MVRIVLSGKSSVLLIMAQPEHKEESVWINKETCNGVLFTRAGAPAFFAKAEMGSHPISAAKN